MLGTRINTNTFCYHNYLAQISRFKLIFSKACPLTTMLYNAVSRLDRTATAIMSFT